MQRFELWQQNKTQSHNETKQQRKKFYNNIKHIKPFFKNNLDFVLKPDTVNITVMKIK